MYQFTQSPSSHLPTPISASSWSSNNNIEVNALFQEVQQFLTDNGHHYVEIVSSAIAYAMDVDPVMTSYWQRIVKDPNRTMFKSEMEGLAILSEGKNIIGMDEGRLLGYLKTRPFDQKLHLFVHGKWIERTLH